MRTQFIYTGYTQGNGAVTIVKTIETAPFFCVYAVYISQTLVKVTYCLHMLYMPHKPRKKTLTMATQYYRAASVPYCIIFGL